VGIASLALWFSALHAFFRVDESGSPVGKVTTESYRVHTCEGNRNVLEGMIGSENYARLEEESGKEIVGMDFNGNGKIDGLCGYIDIWVYTDEAGNVIKANASPAQTLNTVRILYNDKKK
jgi:hypothetical protein